jgi:CRISPR-associated endonuclease Cas2
MTAPSFHTVVAYDVSDDARRQDAAKTILAYAERVQGSVYEGFLTWQERRELLQALEAVLDPGQDRLRIYVHDRRTGLPAAVGSAPHLDEDNVVVV